MRFANVLALCGLFLATAASAAEDAIPWATDYRQAAETAARERKLLLLHFWSDDCPPCRKLEANVFPRPDVAQAVAAGYVPVKVHVDRSPELARRYQVARWPTDVIVTPTGLEVYRTVSPQDPARYIAMLNETAARSGSALAQRESPAQPDKSNLTQPAGYQQQTRSTSPATGHASEFQPPMIENGAPAGNPAAPQKDPRSFAQSGPYAQPGSATGPRTQSAPTESRYSSEFTPQEGAPPAAPDMPAYGAAPHSNQGQVRNPTVQQPPVQQPRPEENKYVAQPPRESAPPVRKAAGGPPPLGMEGYCVVTLAEQGAWMKGDKQFGAIHRGRLYLFGSPEAQKKFLTDPDRFSPALSGYDPVRFAETGELVDGKRAHGLTFNNQVYLFSDEATLERFQASPKAFAETVYQAMLRSDSASKYR